MNYEALRGGLRSGAVAGAGLDVFWEEPFDPSDEVVDDTRFKWWPPATSGDTPRTPTP